MSMRDELKQLSEKVKAYRDEARVQMHLASQEAKDEWNDLEEDWEKFRNRMDNLRHDAEDASKEVSSDVREKTQEWGDNLKSAYENLRNRLK